MKRAQFRFYAELNDFLPPARQMTGFTHTFDVGGAVRDMIESFGVPHTEVDLILVNGRSVDFAYVVQDGDQVSVYPVFESMDITPELKVRPAPLRRTRFVADVHLGRLAAYLRALGFDTLYRNDYADQEMARISSEEGRILLTRDRGLLKRAVVTRGYCVRNTAPRLQLAEVMERFDLARAAAPFTRCLSCNGVLEAVEKSSVLDVLPPRVREVYDEFAHCTACGKVFWKGSHYERMRALLEGLGRKPAGGRWN